MKFSFLPSLAFTLIVTGGMTLTQAAYITDFASNVSSDFVHAQIAQKGSTTSPHQIIDFTGGELNINSRYNQQAATILIASGDSSGGFDGYYTDSITTLDFQYNSASAPERVLVGLASRLSKTPGQVNNYPVYQAELAGDLSPSSLVNFRLIKWTNYNTFTVLDTVTFAGGTAMLGGSANYSLEFSVIGDTTVDLTAELWENGSLLDTLSFTDTTSPIAGGWSGIYAGQYSDDNSYNSNVFEGVDISNFSLVPEPGSLILLGAGSFLLATRRRR